MWLNTYPYTLSMLYFVDVMSLLCSRIVCSMHWIVLIIDLRGVCAILIASVSAIKMTKNASNLENCNLHSQFFIHTKNIYDDTSFLEGSFVFTDLKYEERFSTTIGFSGWWEFRWITLDSDFVETCNWSSILLPISFELKWPKYDSRGGPSPSKNVFMVWGAIVVR